MAFTNQLVNANSLARFFIQFHIYLELILQNVSSCYPCDNTSPWFKATHFADPDFFPPQVSLFPLWHSLATPHQTKLIGPEKRDISLKLHNAVNVPSWKWTLFPLIADWPKQVTAS